MSTFGYEPRVQSWSPNEKDHKLLQLLSSQQQRGRSKAGLTGALPQRARTGPPLNPSSSPTPSINLLGPGKVRQMFEERRNNTKGIDKSNPLEPISSRSSRGSSPSISPTSSTTAGISNVGSSRKTPSPAPLLKQVPMTTNGETIQKSRPNKKISSNITASRSSLFDAPLNNAPLPRPSSLDDLHNLQGPLPRTTKYVDYAEEFESTVRQKEAELKVKLRGLRGLEVVEQGAADLIGSPSVLPPGKAKSKQRAAPETQPLKSPPPGTEPCPICSRCFAIDRLAKHQAICKKTKQKKRTAFDPHSVARTELGIDTQSVQPDRIIPKPPNNSKMNKKLVSGGAGKQNWRSKHDDFIRTIRAAKEYSNHVGNGGDPNDLPPMPDSDYSDYLICPHCERRFGPKAAERHISICGGIKSNK